MSGRVASQGASLSIRQHGQRLVVRFKSLVVYLFFSFGSSVIGLLTMLFLIRHLPPREFGRLAITLGALTVTTPIISLGASNLIAINKTDLAPAAYGSFRMAYGRIAVMNFAFVQIIAIAIWLSGSLDDMVLFVPALALGKFFVDMAAIEYVIEQRAIAYGLVQISTSVVAALATVALVLWVSPEAETRTFALLFADVVVLVARYGSKAKLLLNWQFDKRDFMKIAKFGVPLMLSVGPAYLLNEGDKIVVAQQMGLASAGVYGAACTISNLMLTFITALLNTTVPRMLLALKVGRDAPTRTAIRYAAVFCGLSVAFAAVFLLAYSVAAVYVLPARYGAAITTVYVLVGMMQLRSFYAVIGTVTDYFGMTSEKLAGFILATAVSLGSIIALVPRYGLVGAAFGPGLGYAVLGGWLMFSLTRRQPRQYDAETC